jgi:protein involved in polysaccharide export with SLBB domain
MRVMPRFSSVLWALVALVFVLPGVARSGTDPSARLSPRAEAGESYQLGTGDKVRVIVFGEDDLGGEFQIDSNGRISLPLIGEIQAAGETAASLEEAVEGKLANGYLQSPRVSVEITTYRPFYVIGEVNKPGEYPYVNGMSALNAIALAGGYTTRAKESTIYIRRNGRTNEEEVAADQMTRILPGDVVRIPISPFWAVMSVVSPLASAAYAGAQIAP